MSLYYSLEIATDLRPDDVARLLARDISLKQVGTTELEGKAVTVSVGAQDKASQDIVYENYGFRPTINIVLDLHPSDGYEEGKELIARATVAILRQVNGDAALFYNGEMPILQRCYGHLTIKEGWGDWLVSYLDAFNILYQQREAVTPAA